MGISVIIPLYNKAKTVSRTISSVLNQDIDVEIIVVDDGSTDQSGSVVESFKDRVTYIRQMNAGPSAARNVGAQISQFPFLTFLDADDEFLPGALASHLACRRARRGVKVTIAPPQRLYEQIIRRPHDFVPQGAFYYSNRFLYEAVTGIPIGAICVDRNVFEAIDGFDTDLRCWEVTDFMHRLTLASPIVGFLDKNYVVIHKDHTNSQFVKMQTNMEFQKRVLYKRLDRIDDLPPDQKKMVLRGVSGTVKSFLAIGELSEAREILRRACTHWHVCPELGKLYLLSCLPNPLIRAIIRVRWLLLNLSEIASQRTSKISAGPQQSSDPSTPKNSKGLLGN